MKKDRPECTKYDSVEMDYRGKVINKCLTRKGTLSRLPGNVRKSCI